MHPLLLVERVVYLALRVWARLRDRLYGRAVLRARGVKFGRRLNLQGLPVIRRHKGASIELGEDVVLNSSPRANVLYLARPCVLAAMDAGARIEIGSGSGLSGVALIARKSIRLGERVIVGAGTAIYDTDFHPLDPKKRAEHPTEGAASRPVSIGDDVFIGTSVIILKGVTIGSGAVIGAGAVVAKDVPPGMIAAGNPARVIRAVAGGPGDRPAEGRPTSDRPHDPN